MLLEDEREDEMMTYIHFSSAGSQFLIPISQVKEVLETPAIRAYPIELDGHLGVSNIHGNIIPILSMKALSGNAQIDEKLLSENNRLIIVTTKAGNSFGVLGTAIKKVTTSIQANSTGTSALIDGSLMLLLTSDEILKSWGIS